MSGLTLHHPPLLKAVEGLKFYLYQMFDIKRWMPKIVDHEQYRKELLDKCFNVFAQTGYAAVTMRQLSLEIGVSTGTLYHYFPSKESLFEQLVEYISYQDTAEQNLVKLGSPQTLGAKIQALIEFIAKQEDYFLHQTLMLVDFCRQHSRSEINQNQTLQQAGQRYEQAVKDFLEIQDSNLAQFILNFIDGLIIRRLYQGDRLCLAEQATLLEQLLTPYLEIHQANHQPATERL